MVTRVVDTRVAYEAAVEAKMPHAQIVRDRFHVAKHLNEAADKVGAPSTVRKEERPLTAQKR